MGFWTKAASPKILAYGAVFYSAFGGFLIGGAFLRYLSATDRFSWIYEALTGLAFLLYGVVDVIPLLRLAAPATAPPAARTEPSLTHPSH